METYVSTFRLKPGFDPDESYRLWLEEHAPAVKQISSGLLRKYVIARLRPTFEGEEDIFGMVRLSFDDVEAAWRAMQQIRSLKTEFGKRMTDIRRGFIVDEREIPL